MAEDRLKKQREYCKGPLPGITVSGSGNWTEEEWERLAEAIGATLVRLEED